MRYLVAYALVLCLGVPAIASTTDEDCECFADVDSSGIVDVSDLLTVIAQWQNPGPLGDVNSDGIVNVNDLLIVISDWGTCPEPCDDEFDLDDFDPLDMSTWPDGVETCDEMIAWLGNNIFANDPTTWPDGVDSEAELATWLIQMVTLLDSIC